MADLLHRMLAFFDRDTVRVLWDIGDILLVAFALYYILLVLKGTRAMQMGIGLALVFVVYQAAKRLGLMTLYTILDTLLTSLVLIIVVVFQNDIRRALMRFGRRSLLTSARAAMESHVIEEVVRAATNLARTRIGALIVFEREATLDEFLELGTTLDAAVSKELLYTIFIPSFENPTHDGAAIIREGRIWQAGAFLPLARGSKVDRTLGSRHRAAIGLTEETDAVVVVVSEERGAVSLCFNGNIVRDLDAASLRKVLVRLFDKGFKRRRTKTTPLLSRGIAAIFRAEPLDELKGDAAISPPVSDQTKGTSEVSK
jgi:diadenylate cyclase